MRKKDAGTARKRPEIQYAALAYTREAGDVRYLIVTSRRTGRWVFPKGAAMKGEEPWEAAAREAREEAGVEGVPEREALGRYDSLKIRGARRWTLDVRLYPVAIRKIRKTWNEAGERERRFVTREEARALLSQPEMAALIARFEQERLGETC